MAAIKLGMVTKEYGIDNLPFPNKEEAKAQIKEQDEKKQMQLQELVKDHPEVGDALAKKMALGGKR
jgi:hypothetical protein